MADWKLTISYIYLLIYLIVTDKPQICDYGLQCVCMYVCVVVKIFADCGIIGDDATQVSEEFHCVY